MTAERKTGSNWAKVNTWLMDKIVSTEGALVPMDRDAMFKRPKAKLDYQVVLENASRTMIRFRKPERLIRMIVRLIDQELKTTHTAVLLYKEDKNAFVLIDSKGSEGVKIPVNFIRMTFDNPLVKIFASRQNYMISDTGTLALGELKSLHENKEAFKNHPELEELVDLVLKQMSLLRAEVCIPCYYKKDLIGVLVLGPKQSNQKFSRQEIGFFMTLANDAAMAISNAQLIENLQEKVEEVKDLYVREHRIFIHTSIALATAIDARDPYTHGHTERVTQYALSLADEIEGIPEALAYKNFRETLHISALLHDVGKIGCPDRVLNKKCKLTPEEYEKIKEHPGVGAAILMPIKELSDVAREIRGHQERYDGRGYPDGLKATEIPLIARIIAVCDAFDAITTDRPYRKHKSAELAIEELRKESGIQFDPIVVSAFVLAFEKGKILPFSSNKRAKNIPKK
ncbi:MAG: HD domain-containing protein [Candidatus Omnitrophica bacterium]|nr:HD domain-containing protein [Candidatus Omnitrophota bacterium]